MVIVWQRGCRRNATAPFASMKKERSEKIEKIRSYCSLTTMYGKDFTVLLPFANWL